MSIQLIITPDQMSNISIYFEDFKAAHLNQLYNFVVGLGESTCDKVFDDLPTYRAKDGNFDAILRSVEKIFKVFNEKYPHHLYVAINFVQVKFPKYITTKTIDPEVERLRYELQQKELALQQLMQERQIYAQQQQDMQPRLEN